MWKANNAQSFQRFLLDWEEEKILSLVNAETRLRSLTNHRREIQHLVNVSLIYPHDNFKITLTTRIFTFKEKGNSNVRGWAG